MNYEILQFHDLNFMIIFTFLFVKMIVNPLGMC